MTTEEQQYPKHDTGSFQSWLLKIRKEKETTNNTYVLINVTATWYQTYVSNNNIIIMWHQILAKIPFCTVPCSITFTISFQPPFPSIFIK